MEGLVDAPMRAALTAVGVSTGVLPIHSRHAKCIAHAYHQRLAPEMDNGWHTASVRPCMCNFWVQMSIFSRKTPPGQLHWCTRNRPEFRMPGQIRQPPPRWRSIADEPELPHQIVSAVRATPNASAWRRPKCGWVISTNHACLIVPRARRRRRSANCRACSHQSRGLQTTGALALHRANC